ncbi:MAG: terminase small subunit [Pyrinomonadaceae bacterium]
MPRRCTICDHVKRNAIETALNSGTPFRNIAAEFQVTSSSVFRHREHIELQSQVKPTATSSNGNGHHATLTRHDETPIEPDETTPELSPRQELFVAAYVGDMSVGRILNATEAARAAGYAGNDNVLGVQGHRLLKVPKVRSAISERLAALHVHMGADEVLAELARIGRTDWGDLVEVKYGKDGDVIFAQLRLTDKLKALDLLGKYHSLFTDTVIEQRVTVILAEKAQGMYRRLREELGAVARDLSDDELAGWAARVLDVPVEMVSSGITNPSRLLESRTGT